MKKLLVVFFVLPFLATETNAQEPLIYTGEIDKYPIELSIQSCDVETGVFKGTYKYKSKKTSLNITGEYTPPILYFVETNLEDTTGYFYLEMEGGQLSGTWVAATNDKSYSVLLNYSSGNKNLLYRKSELDYNKEVNSDITGSYENNSYFLNDMWVSEGNLHPEVGYNGGMLTVNVREDGNIDFIVEAVCGPTYHLAYAEGIAEKVDGQYIYRNEDGCMITFVFSDKKVEVKANASMDCGFGARAYLDHIFVKVSDVVTVHSEE